MNKIVLALSTLILLCRAWGTAQAASRSPAAPSHWNQLTGVGECITLKYDNGPYYKTGFVMDPPNSESVSTGMWLLKLPPLGDNLVRSETSFGELFFRFNKDGYYQVNGFQVGSDVLTFGVKYRIWAVKANGEALIYRPSKLDLVVTGTWNPPICVHTLSLTSVLAPSSLQRMRYVYAHEI